MLRVDEPKLGQPATETRSVRGSQRSDAKSFKRERNRRWFRVRRTQPDASLRKTAGEPGLDSAHVAGLREENIMPKGVSKMANQQAGAASSQEGQFTNSMGQDSNAIMPELQKEIGKPEGYTPGQMAGMNTASQQAAGGSQAGAITQGSLASGRTRNAGGYGAAIADSGASAGRGLAQRALGVQTENAQLAQSKQQNALKEVGGLYGTNVQGLNDMYKNANDSLNTNLAADKQNQENMTQDISTGMKIATTPFGGGASTQGLAGMA
jgi:hypothetical protein